eukprot:IDg10057t1
MVSLDVPDLEGTLEATVRVRCCGNVRLIEQEAELGWLRDACKTALRAIAQMRTMQWRRSNYRTRNQARMAERYFSGRGERLAARCRSERGLLQSGVCSVRSVPHSQWAQSVRRVVFAVFAMLFCTNGSGLGLPAQILFG